MLTLKIIRERPKEVIERLALKNFDLEMQLSMTLLKDDLTFYSKLH